MARVTFRSEARRSGKGLRTDVRSRDHRVVVDEPAALGGSDEGQTPMELALGALGACLAIMASLFAPAHGVELRGSRVIVEGDLDPDGLQGKAPVRPGFQEVRCRFEVDTPSPREHVQALVEHIQRACPVTDSLRNGVQIRVTGWQASYGREAA